MKGKIPLISPLILSVLLTPERKFSLFTAPIRIPMLPFRD